LKQGEERMAYELGCNGEGRTRQEKKQAWLKKNNRIRVECTEEGVIVTNICCRSLRIRSNGNGSLKAIRKRRSTGLLTEGQNIFIEGKTFQVQPVA